MLEMARQAGSTPMNRVVHDVRTNRVMISENGASFEQAPAAIASMFTGVSYRDPGLLDPVTAENAEVRSMLSQLIDYYWPELLEHSRIDAALDAMIRSIHHPTSQRTLLRLSTNYERWDRIIESLFDSFEE